MSAGGLPVHERHDAGPNVRQVVVASPVDHDDEGNHGRARAYQHRWANEQVSPHPASSRVTSAVPHCPWLVVQMWCRDAPVELPVAGHLHTGRRLAPRPSRWFSTRGGAALNENERGTHCQAIDASATQPNPHLGRLWRR